jgi:hypothetical protein
VISTNSKNIIVFSSLHPVARAIGEAERLFDGTGRLVRVEDVRDFNFNARHGVSHVEKLLRFREVDVGQRRIVLVHAGLKQRDQREGADLRHHADCTDRTGGRGHHIDRIPDKDAESQRQFFAQDDAGFFCLDCRAVRIVGGWLLHLDRPAEVG